MIYRMGNVQGKPWAQKWDNPRQVIQAAQAHACHLREDIYVYTQQRPGGRLQFSRVYLAKPQPNGRGGWQTSTKYVAAVHLTGREEYALPMSLAFFFGQVCH